MSSHDFEIHEQQEDLALVLRLSGELDLASTPVFEERLGRLAAEGRAVRLDLSELEFMDSTGLRALVNALGAASANGWQLEVVSHFRPQVSRLLSLAHVDRVIPGAHANGTLR